MNQIRFCEFVNFVCTTVPFEYHEKIKIEGVNIWEELFNKKKFNEMAENKCEEVMEEIRRAFTHPTEKNIISYRPKDSDFLTSNCCESVLKKFVEKEKSLANRSLRTSIYIGHAAFQTEHLEILKSVKTKPVRQTKWQTYLFTILSLFLFKVV